MFRRIIITDASRTTLLIRLMVGVVFLSEGIQKFLYPAVRGAGRFADVGLPEPDFLGYFVGSFEVICGIFILAGFLTRLAALPLIVIMITAILTTKIPTLAEEGFWQMMHAARTDWAMMLGSLFLLIRGGGRWSADGLTDMIMRRVR